MKRLVDSSWTLSFDDGVREERELTEGMIGRENQLEAVIANLEQRPGNSRTERYLARRKASAASSSAA